MLLKRGARQPRNRDASLTLAPDDFNVSLASRSSEECSTPPPSLGRDAHPRHLIPDKGSRCTRSSGHISRRTAPARAFHGRLLEGNQFSLSPLPAQAAVDSELSSAKAPGVPCRRSLVRAPSHNSNPQRRRTLRVGQQANAQR